MLYKQNFTGSQQHLGSSEDKGEPEALLDMSELESSAKKLLVKFQIPDAGEKVAGRDSDVDSLLVSQDN